MQRKGFSIAPLPATTLLLLRKSRQPAPPFPQPAFGKCFQRAGRIRESLEPAAMQMGWIILQQTFPPSSLHPPYHLYCLGAHSLCPPLPSLAPYTYTSPCTSSPLLQQPLTKTSSPLVIPSLFKIGRPRELIDKVHTSHEFLFYSPDSSVMFLSSLFILASYQVPPPGFLPFPLSEYTALFQINSTVFLICCCLLKVLLHVYGM